MTSSWNILIITRLVQSGLIKIQVGLNVKFQHMKTSIFITLIDGKVFMYSAYSKTCCIQLKVSAFENTVIWYYATYGQVLMCMTNVCFK